MLELRDVSLERAYGLGGPFIRRKRFTVLAGLNWRLPERGLALIRGPAGCGKTSLLLLLAGALRPAAGELFIDGRPTRRRGGRRRRLLFAANLYLGPEPAAWQLEERVGELSKVARVWAVELTGRCHDDATRLGGLCRWERLALALGARLAMRPRVLLLDDPAAGLDPARVDALVGAIKKAAADRLVVAAAAEPGSLSAAAGLTLVLDQSSPGHSSSRAANS